MSQSRSVTAETENPVSVDLNCTSLEYIAFGLEHIGVPKHSKARIRSRHLGQYGVCVIEYYMAVFDLYFTLYLLAIFSLFKWNLNLIFLHFIVHMWSDA